MPRLNLTVLFCVKLSTFGLFVGLSTFLFCDSACLVLVQRSDTSLGTFASGCAVCRLRFPAYKWSIDGLAFLKKPLDAEGPVKQQCSSTR